MQKLNIILSTIHKGAIGRPFLVLERNDLKHVKLTIQNVLRTNTHRMLRFQIRVSPGLCIWEDFWSEEALPCPFPSVTDSCLENKAQQ